MKFLCVKENLGKALALAERFTGKNLTLAILGNVLLKAEENVLRVSATNLEYGVEIVVPGQVSRPGLVSVPAKILNSLVQSGQEGKLELEEKQGNLFVKTDTRDIRINGTPPDDFPLIPKIKKTSTFTIDSSFLEHGLGKVLPSVSSSEFKPELNGVLFKIAGKTLRLAATDTFRLAEKTLELSAKSEGESFSFILPQRVSQELSRIAGSDEVRVSLGENQVMFEIGGIKIISRLIEGNFPEYSAIIPKDFETSAFLDLPEFIDIVRSSSIFASKLQEVKLEVRGKNLEVTTLNPEVGEYKTKLSISTTGKDITISFNFRYLLDGLNSLDEKEFFLGLNSENNPALLRNKNDSSFLYVLMPIRLS